MNGDWQTLVRASSGYLELGMFDDAARVLEKVAPEDQSRGEILALRVGLFIMDKKWDMALATASHLVTLEPKDPAWWIVYAHSTRYAESIEKAEVILLQARELHPKHADISLNLACYASVRGRFEEAKVRLRHAIELDRDVPGLALEEDDLRPLWDWIVSSK